MTVLTVGIVVSVKAVGTVVAVLRVGIDVVNVVGPPVSTVKNVGILV